MFPMMFLPMFINPAYFETTTYPARSQPSSSASAPNLSILKFRVHPPAPSPSRVSQDHSNPFLSDMDSTNPFDSGDLADSESSSPRIFCPLSFSAGHSSTTSPTTRSGPSMIPARLSSSKSPLRDSHQSLKPPVSQSLRYWMGVRQRKAHFLPLQLTSQIGVIRYSY